MKKSNILIAVLMAIAAAPMANAAEIDFDGRNSGSLRSVNFAINNSGINQDIPEIPAPTVESRKIQDLDIDSMSGDDLKRMKHRLNSSIKTAIDYCNKNHLDDMQNNFAALLAHGTIKDKNDFVNNRAAKYVFPVMKTLGAEILEASSGQQKGGNPYCVAWGKQNVCVDKMVCKYTCIIVGATVATWGSVNGVWQIIIPAAVGTEVCKDVCANVPICADVPYCTQWETEVI